MVDADDTANRPGSSESEADLVEIRVAGDIEVLSGFEESPIIDATVFISEEKLSLTYTDIDYGSHNQVSSNVAAIDEGYVFGVAPHHDVAAPMIDEFYNHLATDGIERIILVGPDHLGTGEGYSVATHTFSCYDGLVPVDELTYTLIDAGVVAPASVELMSEEHSIGIHMNYIAKYYPGVPVVSVYVRDYMSMAGVLALVEVIEGDNKTLVIGSVDFSHDQSWAEAEVCDEETAQMILAWDYKRLFGHGDAWLDSSAALCTVMVLAERNDHKQVTFIDHDNSAKLLRQPEISSTTSYFTIGW